MPIITNKDCESMYRRAGYIEDIPNIFVCAGLAKGTKDSCEVIIFVDFFWTRMMIFFLFFDRVIAVDH